MTDANSMKVLETIDSLRERFIEISRGIHANPELGREEYKAAALLTSELENLGFKVERKIAGLETAFRAVYEGEKERPTLAFLAEYDAVPGLGHACGHNLIAMCAVAAAAGLAGLGEKLLGKVMVLGTPDEEGLGGKIDMIQQNVFENVDAALMIHAMNEWLVYNYDFALDSLMIEFRGKPAHYTRPWEGINALDTSTLMLNAVNIIRHQILPSVVIGYMILKGGEATSVVPDDVKMRITMKSAQGSYLSQVREKIENAARGCATATGAKVNIIPRTTFENSIPNTVLLEVVRQKLKMLGAPVQTLEYESRRKPGGGSTDYGNVSKVVPSISICPAVGPRNLVLHTPEFQKASVSDEAHSNVIIAAKALALAGLDLLSNPTLLNKAKGEFEQYRSSKFTNVPLIPKDEQL
jgi:amidohydrolase